LFPTSLVDILLGNFKPHQCFGIWTRTVHTVYRNSLLFVVCANILCCC